MKKLIAISVLLTGVVIFISSCGKYEEGPEFSLRSKTSKVAASWEFEKILINDVETNIDSLSGFQYILEKDGTGKTKWDTLEKKLEWEFDDARKKIRMRYENSDNSFDSWSDDAWTTIIRLKKTELWIIAKIQKDLNFDGVTEEATEEIHLIMVN